MTTNQSMVESLDAGTVMVTLTRQQYIQLRWLANFYRNLHQRAVERLRVNDAQHKATLSQLRDQYTQHELQHAQALRRQRDEGAQREAALQTALDAATALVRDLRQRLFGRKSESCGHSEACPPTTTTTPARRGQRRGAPGHGRTLQTHLPARIETIRIDNPNCPKCGFAFAPFPRYDSAEIIEIEVKAYRRVIRRQCYQKACHCGGVPGIVTAPAPARLIERGKFGISVWTTVLLDKFLYGRPSHRLLQDLADHGLSMSPGTLTGGLQRLAPLFAPLEEALVAKLRSEDHWHADETRWAVFVIREGKVGYRWYLWVFHSPSAIRYVLAPSRSTKVVQEALAGVERGTMSCDRYSAYKKFARLNPNVVLAFCWAHQRRDFLTLANAHPELSAWAFVWVNAIAVLYQLNERRCQASVKARADRDDNTDCANSANDAEYSIAQAALEQAVQAMACERDRQLADPLLAPAAAKVLRSMSVHWDGLTVFVGLPLVPMDNNVAERDMRGPVVGRKNFYGSGSEWSGHLAATMYSLLMTLQSWGINARTWLGAYLQACADNGNQAPSDISVFLPWAMDAKRLAMMGVHPLNASPLPEGIDSS